MAIFAISDLHLAFDENKPMDIFGVNWENHFNKIAQDWKEKVKDEDLVILAGDFSWATYLENTVKDFEYLNNLPGRKVLLKGNHDYWWETKTKMNKFLLENNIDNIEFLFNNCIEYNGYSICGTRGWAKTDDSKYDDKKIFKREYERLRYSLEQTKTDNIIVVLHFPPDQQIIEILKEYNVKKCIYGHLHGKFEEENMLNGIVDGIEYYCTSCDFLDFKLIEI